MKKPYGFTFRFPVDGEPDLGGFMFEVRDTVTAKVDVLSPSAAAAAGFPLDEIGAAINAQSLLSIEALDKAVQAVTGERDQARRLVQEGAAAVQAVEGEREDWRAQATQALGVADARLSQLQAANARIAELERQLADAMGEIDTLEERLNAPPADAPSLDHHPV